MVAEAAPTLVAVESHTFELPQPKPLGSPARLPVASKDGRRMLPGKDGRLYKADRGA